MADPNAPATEKPPIPASATMTFDEWVEADETLKDKAKAFKALFGPGAEQKMDRGTLDLHLKTLEQHEAAHPPAAPTTPPPTDPNAPPAA